MSEFTKVKMAVGVTVSDFLDEIKSRLDGSVPKSSIGAEKSGNIGSQAELDKFLKDNGQYVIGYKHDENGVLASVELEPEHLKTLNIDCEEICITPYMCNEATGECERPPFD